MSAPAWFRRLLDRWQSRRERILREREERSA